MIFFIDCIGPGTYPTVGTDLHSVWVSSEYLFLGSNVLKHMIQPHRRIPTYGANWTIHRQTN